MSGARFFNRELSWLEFNARVLEEARDPAIPPLERLRFLSIVSSNFDEFFMVRVAALKTAAAAVGTAEGPRDLSGLDAAGILAAIARRAKEIVAEQYTCLDEEVLPALEAGGLAIVRPGAWSPAEQHYLERYFAEQLAPALTPLRVEGDKGFPATGNLRISAGFILREAGTSVSGGAPGGAADEGDRVAIVQVPANLDRFVPLPSEPPRLAFALLDEITMAFGHRLFPGYMPREACLFKITRDADRGVDEERDEDFVAAMEELVAGRESARPIRLSISTDSELLRVKLMEGYGLGEDDVYRVDGPIDLRGFMRLASLKGLDALRYPVWRPAPALPAQAEETPIWDIVRKKDLFLHLPYEGFEPVLRFLDEAADDPSVLAIKIALYRTSGESPIVKALDRAARAGKQVTAIVELKARFDEERNIGWAGRLERAGAIVVYGVARLKVHAKAALVVRREDDGSLSRYCHLSTGNYNDRTARLYSDFSLLTANADLCRDVSALFNSLSGWSAVQSYKLLSVAPYGLKERIVSMIDREALRSSAESPGAITAKMNALADPDVIEALYRASAAGVRVKLNVRGVCCLVPGVAGLSETITVVSVVGRDLEHARAMRFRNGGAEELYVSSADWMPRNLERRIEIMYPILDEEARERLRDILASYFEDAAKGRRLLPSGRWERMGPAGAKEAFGAQESFRTDARRRAEARDTSPRDELLVRRKAPPER